MSSVKFVKIVMTGSSRVRTEKKCNLLEKTDETMNVNRSNKFDVLNTVDSGTVRSVWPIRKKGVTRTKATNTVRLQAAKVLR